MLQCFVRRCLARQEYMQRRFVYLLVQTAEAERAKKINSMNVQEKLREEMRDMQREEAARVIQRFFFYVKKEVDKLIIVKTRRKRWRKKKTIEKGAVGYGESLLEDVWLELIALQDEHFTSQFDKFRVFSKLRLVEDDYDAEKKPHLTEAMTFAPHPTINIRIVSKLDGVEMDDNFKLEEAFIDAEVMLAKERRVLAENVKRVSRKTSKKLSNRYLLVASQGKTCPG